MKRYILSAVAGGAMMVGMAFAQSTAPSNPQPGSTATEREHYYDRQERQADRIQEGVENGKLTPQQGKALERQNKMMGREAHSMAQANGGTLSEKQEAQLHRQMNRQNRRIYRAKH